MNIRSMKIDDYDAVYALWLSCPGMGLNNFDDSRAGIRKYLKRNPNTCFVAVEGGRVVGAILAGHDGRRGYISHTAVAPDCQRGGIGGQLVAAALEGLKSEGIAKFAGLPDVIAHGMLTMGLGAGFASTWSGDPGAVTRSGRAARSRAGRAASAATASSTPITTVQIRFFVFAVISLHTFNEVRNEELGVRSFGRSDNSSLLTPNS